MLIRRITLVFLLLVLAGCAPSAKPLEEAVSADDAPASLTTLRFWKPDWDPHWDTLVEAFQEAEPGIRVVNVNPRPGANMSGIIRKDEPLLQAIRRGTADVVPLRVTGIDESDFLPLDPLLQRDRVDLSGYGRLLDNLRTNGRVHELPVTATPVMILYNQELFRKAGLPMPRPGWSWTELLDAAARLSSGEGDAKVWGIADLSSMQLRLPLTMLRQEMDAGTAEAERVEQVLHRWASAATRERTFWVSDTVRTIELHQRGYREGKIAMLFDEVSNPETLRVLGQVPDWVAVPAPSGNPRDRTLYVDDPVTLAIPAASQQQEAAWRFLRFLSGPEGSELIARHGMLPAYRNEAAKAAFLDRTPAPLPGTEVLFEWDLALLRKPGGEPHRKATTNAFA